MSQVATRPRRPSLRPLEHFTGRTLVGLAAIVAAGTGFALLYVLVRLHWAPLYGADHGVADWLNARVAPHRPVVAALHRITDLGGRPIMLWLVGVVAVGLAIRRRWRLSAYLVVTGVGALLLDPSLKLLVGRLRPMVEEPIASAPGNSFPSGHALGSMVTYGALLLVFLPAVPRRARTPLTAGFAAVVATIGFTRVALGVHFVSDVIGGWLLGAAWLGVTAHAFRLWRRETGRPEVPLREGLEPEAARDVAPAPREHHVLPRPLLGAAEILTGWVLIFGVLYLFGTLVSRAGGVVRDADVGVVRWFAERRTPALDDVSWLWSKAGDTHAILIVSLVFCPILLAVVRRWRPVLFLALTMIGELTLFLASAGAVDRPRPPVELLDGKLPTSAFPSGHIAATMCLYTAIAVLVMPRTRRWWRWVTVALAVIMPFGVALSRMYRGMHHPTDVLGALLLTTLWVGLLYLVIRPNSPDDPDAAVAAGRADADRAFDDADRDAVRPDVQPAARRR